MKSLVENGEEAGLMEIKVNLSIGLHQQHLLLLLMVMNILLFIQLMIGHIVLEQQLLQD